MATNVGADRARPHPMRDGISIYLPGNLKAEMDRIPGVNWSAVAQRAFADEIKHMKNNFHATLIVKVKDIDKLRDAKSRLDEANDFETDDATGSLVVWAFHHMESLLDGSIEIIDATCAPVGSTDAKIDGELKWHR